MEHNRQITADMAAQLETSAIDVHEVASLVSVVQQSFFNGSPDPELMAEALNSVSNTLLRIHGDLMKLVSYAYGKNDLPEKEEEHEGGRPF